MTKSELGDNLRRIGHSRKKDPQDSKSEMSALQIKFEITIAADKKAAVILRAGQKDYALVVTDDHHLYHHNGH